MTDSTSDIPTGSNGPPSSALTIPGFPHSGCKAAGNFSTYVEKIQSSTGHTEALREAFEKLSLCTDRDPAKSYEVAKDDYKDAIRSFGSTVATVLADISGLHQTNLRVIPLSEEQRIPGLFPCQQASAATRSADFYRIVPNGIRMSEEDCQDCESLAYDADALQSTADGLHEYTYAALDKDVKASEELVQKYNLLSMTNKADVHGLLVASHTKFWEDLLAEKRGKEASRAAWATTVCQAMDNASSRRSGNFATWVQMSGVDPKGHVRKQAGNYPWPLELLAFCTSEKPSSSVSPIILPRGDTWSQMTSLTMPLG